MLNVRKLQKIFVRDDSSVVALDDINFSVQPGEFVSIVGHSGSGKSTLLNLLHGMLRPTKGYVVFNGGRIDGLGDESLSKLRNVDIGYIMQGQNLLQNFTMYENIIMPMFMCDEKKEYRDANELMKLMKIEHIRDKYPSDVSGGETKRCEIARALFLNPRLIIADEPVADLDPENVEIIMNAFASIAKKGTAIVMATHNMDTVKYSDTVYEMEAGCLIKKE